MRMASVWRESKSTGLRAVRRHALRESKPTPKPGARLLPSRTCLAGAGGGLKGRSIVVPPLGGSTRPRYRVPQLHSPWKGIPRHGAALAGVPLSGRATSHHALPRACVPPNGRDYDGTAFQAGHCRLLARTTLNTYPSEERETAAGSWGA